MKLTQKSLAALFLALVVLVVLASFGAARHVHAQTLTTQQGTTLRAAILADATAAAAWSGGQDATVVARMNETDTAFWVWRTQVPVHEITNVIVWANLTPNDSPDSTVLYQNRLVFAQSKQFNLNLLFVAAQAMGGIVNAGLPNVRTGYQEALTGLPTGTGGATVAAGWTAVRDGPFKRNANRVERALADTASSGCAAGTALANPACLAWQGPINTDHVTFMRGLP